MCDHSRIVSTRQPEPVLHLALVGLLLRGVLSLISAANAILLARALGPGGRGEYFLFVAAVATVSRLADLGMSPSAVVFASRWPERWARIHTVITRTLLGTSIVAALIGVAGVTVLGPDEMVAIVGDRWLLGLAALPFALYEHVWIHLMVGLKRIPAMNIVQVLGGLLALTLNVVLVVGPHAGASVAIGVFVGVTLLKTTSMLLFARHVLPRPSTASTAPLARDMLLFGLRGYPNSLAALLWTRLPAFILGASQGVDAVGIFSASQQVLEQLLLPVQAVQDAIYPNVARASRASSTVAMNTYLRVTIWAITPALILAAVTAPWTVPFVFGSSYARSVPVFQILVVSAGATAVSSLVSPYFFGQLRRPGLISMLAWGKVLIAVGLSAVLVSSMAELGAAVALVCAEAVTISVTLVLYSRAARTPLSQALLLQAGDVARIVSGFATQLHSARAALQPRRSAA